MYMAYLCFESLGYVFNLRQFPYLVKSPAVILMLSWFLKNVHNSLSVNWKQNFLWKKKSNGHWQFRTLHWSPERSRTPHIRLMIFVSTWIHFFFKQEEYELVIYPFSSNLFDYRTLKCLGTKTNMWQTSLTAAEKQQIIIRSWTIQMSTHSGWQWYVRIREKRNFFFLYWRRRTIRKSISFTFVKDNQDRLRSSKQCFAACGAYTWSCQWGNSARGYFIQRVCLLSLAKRLLRSLFFGD